uniref:NADH dehydrogenase subunit 6 n=1 Tax=Spirobolus grahami TaxID=3065235 RepID=A0AA49K4S1_9MYRI|nr:NADH dehydrogenase subunit 6 [Spirobolus grahami]WKY95844.1 NADH dehydrogenase subunit 6 [Spirobolus grahami]
MIPLLMLPLSVIFLQLHHPLGLALTVIFTALISSLSIFALTRTSWLSYVLVLIFIGGILVLLTYIASLAPSSKTTNPYILPVPLLTIPLLYSFNNPSHFTFIQPTLTLKTLFSPSLSPMTITLVTFLLITLLVITQLVKMSEGPLRSTMYD